MSRILIALVCVLFLVCSTVGQAVVYDPDSAWEIYSRLNNARQERRLPLFIPTNGNTKVASDYTYKMAVEDKFVHNPNLEAQLRRENSQTTWWGECIGKAGNAVDTFNFLMQSPGHYAVMMDTQNKYKWVGIGAYRKGAYLWVTLDFSNGGNPSVACCGVSGAIAALYRGSNLGGVLGNPTTNEMITPSGIGRYNHFQRGSIYWSPNTGAHEVHGLIKERWAQLNWENSPLGYPTTNENTCPDNIGKYNHFERGSIYWTPSTGAHEVMGAIHNFWKNSGWENGPLGYPVSNEFDVAEGKRSNFQRGALIWNRASNSVRRV